MPTTKKLYRLLERHKGKFSNFGAVDYARKIRNRLGHGEGNPTDTQVMRAEIDLERGVRDLLPHCSDALCRDAVGEPKPPLPPKPFVPPPKPDPPRESQGAGAAPVSTPPPPPPPGWLARPRFWFLLAGVAAFMTGAAYLAQPRTQQAQPSCPSGGSGPGFFQPPPATDSARKDPAVDPTAPDRESQFRNLINRNLSVSAAQPNLAVLIDSSGPPTPGSVGDSLSGFLGGSKVKIINNLADINALKTQGFFNDLYGGNSKFLSQAAQLSHVDYILLGDATYSFRRQAELDPDLTTCDLSLSARLADRAGTFVESDSFSVTGPGFTQAQARERALENAAQRLKEKILNAIR